MKAQTAKRWLLIIWISCTAFLVCIGVYGLLTGGYCDGDSVFCEKQEAYWEWLLPATIPTLLMMIAVVAHDHAEVRHDLYVDRFFLFLAAGCSIAYFLLLLVTEITFNVRGDPEVLNSTFNLVTDAVQSVVIGTIGILFVRQRMGG